MTLSIAITQAVRDALPEVLQAEYNPMPDKNGMFLLDTEAVEVDGQRWATENVTGLRTTVESTRNERDTLKTELSKFQGIDLAEYKRLVSKKEEIDGWDPSNDDATKQRLEESNANWQAKYDTDLGAATKAAASADEKYRLYLKTATAQAALNKLAPKAAHLLMPHVLPMLEVYGTEDASKDAVYVRGDDGKPRITQVAGQTGNMTASELMNIMKDDERFIAVMPGTGATGGGATGSGKDTGNRGPNLEGLSATERLKAAHRANAG